MGDRPWHDFIHCPLNNHQCQTFRNYALTHDLIESTEVPGCKSLKRRRGTVQSKKVLRRAFRALVACHRAGFCMSGKFTAENFMIDDHSQVRLHNVHLVELTDTEDADEDYYQFVRMTFDEVYDREPTPLEVIRWLKLINQGRRGYEYVICYHTSLMEHRQAITNHMSLYMIFLELEHQNPSLHELIISWLPQYDGWRKRQTHFINALVEKARTYRDPHSGKEATYDDDIKGVLKLIRNCWQHPCRFHEAVLTLIIEVDFPDLLADFQEAMFDAAQLGKLNLESTME